MGDARAAFAELAIGRTVTFSKTVGEADVYLFAGLTGDLSPNHVDEEYMRRTRYGRRIAHGALIIGWMSNTSSQVCQGVAAPVVSYGYDRVRFPAPLFIGDTVTVTYEIESVDVPAGKAFSKVTCTNQRGEVVAAALHILKVVES